MTRAFSHEIIDETRGFDILEMACQIGAKLKKVTAAEWVGRCPACGGTDRFSVNISRRVFNCRSYGGGDVIAMVQHALGLNFGDAIEFIAGPENRAVPARARVVPPLERPSVHDQRRRVERARAIFGQGVDPRGTIVDAYLAKRRLGLADDVAGFVVRFHPACPWRDGDSDTTIYVPAMVAAMRSIASNEITAIHRTRLSEEGQKVERRMLGVAAGAAIKIDADDAVTYGLHIGEGLETAMAARQLGLRPTWALGSTSFIAGLPVLPGIECLTILAENDTASAKAVETCAARWHAAGRIVLINRPARGKDLNDAVRGLAP
jgi:hypothetical protein